MVVLGTFPLQWVIEVVEAREHAWPCWLICCPCFVLGREPSYFLEAIRVFAWFFFGGGGGCSVRSPVWLSGCLAVSRWHCVMRLPSRHGHRCAELGEAAQQGGIRPESEGPVRSALHREGADAHQGGTSDGLCLSVLSFVLRELTLITVGLPTGSVFSACCERWCLSPLPTSRAR
jgi:hypothetical protein